MWMNIYPAFKPDMWYELVRFSVASCHGTDEKELFDDGMVIENFITASIFIRPENLPAK